MAQCPTCASDYDAEVEYCPSDGAPLDPLVGRILDNRYRVEERIGSGGIGAVYRAQQLSLRKSVAVKVLRSELASLPEFVKRFDREARAMSRLTHVNIVAVTDFGVSDGMAYISMELLEGVSLSDEIARGRLPLSRALFLTRQILAALAYAHSAGVVHRDLKPQNVIVVNQPGVRDLIKILDFGLAKFLTEDAGAKHEQTLTQAGTVFGTPAYMPPEQAAGSDADPRSDLYSTGVMLFEMAVGKRPFSSDSRAELIRQHLLMPPPIPSSVAPSAQIPRQLDECILKALEKSVDKRFGSALEFAEAIDRIEAGGSAYEPGSFSGLHVVSTGSTTIDHTTPSAVKLRRTPRPRSRSPIATSLAVIGTILGLIPTGPRARRFALWVLLLGGLAYGVWWAANLELWSDLGLSARRAVASAGRTVDKIGEGASRTVDRFGEQVDRIGDAVNDPSGSPSGASADRPRPRDPWRAPIPGTLGQSRAALRRDQPGRAANLAKNYVARNRQDPRGHLALGHAYFGMLYWSDSLEQYELALRLDPTVRGDPALLGNLVSCLGNHNTHVRRRCRTLLRREFGTEAIAPLVNAATRGSTTYAVAHGAAEALRDLGAESALDQVAFRITDLERAPNCPMKREAFDRLRTMRDARVTAALRRVDGFTARCLGDRLTSELAARSR